MLKAEFLLSLGIEHIINYLRKSRADEEHERKTGEDVLNAQKELMDRLLEPIGIPYDQRPEVGSGDKIETRPVFQTVLRDLRAGKFQAIAVKEISRMGRGSYTDMGTIYDLIQERRIFIITPYKVYDPRNPSDLRQIRFELFMSREEFETTRERLFGGRVNNAMAGRWVAGAAPFGFDYNPTTKKLEINESEADVVRQLFDFYVNGVPDENGKRRDVSFRALATYLNRKTLLRTPRGGRNWSPHPLRQLLTNERYIGTMS
ncbi:MAG: recombinase family protein, partial [Cohnella sp.]|nr:recombinase family protein [Cohnella sp.]